MLTDAMLDLTNRGDLVLDPFLGSGSKLAAHGIGRRCFVDATDGVKIDNTKSPTSIDRQSFRSGRKPSSKRMVRGMNTSARLLLEPELDQGGFTAEAEYPEASRAGQQNS